MDVGQANRETKARRIADRLAAMWVRPGLLADSAARWSDVDWDRHAGEAMSTETRQLVVSLLRSRHRVAARLPADPFKNLPS